MDNVICNSDITCEICKKEIKKGKTCIKWTDNRFVHKKCQPYPCQK